MIAAPFVQPDHTDDAAGLGNAYKGNIDNAIYVMARMAAAFAPRQSQSGSPSLPDMTVTVDPGAFLSNGSLVTQAQQVTAAFTAAASNPKRGLVYIDQLTGAVGIATGSEAASPSLPALPAGKIPVASVLIGVGMTEITYADLTDLRPAWSAFYAAAIPYDNSTSGLAASNVKEAIDELSDGGADQLARDIAISALIAATSTGGIRGPVVSWVASADNFSTKTGATFSTDHYHNPAAATADLTGSGTVLKDSEQGGRAAVNAFDNNSGTSWKTNGASPGTAYIGYDFGAGSPTGYHIRQFTIQQVSGSAVSSVLVQWSDNGSAWTTADTVALVTDSSLQTKQFAASAAHRYWRLLSNSATTGGLWEVSEVEFMEVTTVPDMTLSDDAETIGANCQTVDVYVSEKTVDVSPTRRIRASLDGGGTWATGALIDTFTFADRTLYRYEVDVSAQSVGSPSNRSLKVEYNTLNDGKERNFYRVDAVPLYAD